MRIDCTIIAYYHHRAVRFVDAHFAYAIGSLE